MDTDRLNVAVADEPIDLLDRFLGAVDEGIGLGARHQRPIRPVAAIGKALRDERDAIDAGGLERGARQAHDRQVELRRGDDEEVGEFAVAAGLVVERRRVA